MSLRLEHTLQEIILSPNNDNFSLRRIAKYLMDQNYSGDYRMGYNVVMNGTYVLNCIPNVQADDFIWLCNKIGASYQKNLSCRDNDRLCAADMQGQPNAHYQRAQRNGCCGFYDDLITNPMTGNKFWFGFNYGH